MSWIQSRILPLQFAHFISTQCAATHFKERTTYLVRHHLNPRKNKDWTTLNNEVRGGYKN